MILRLGTIQTFEIGPVSEMVPSPLNGDCAFALKGVID